MIFAQLYNQSLEKPLGRVLVANYLAALVTLTAWIALILGIVSSDQ